MNKIKEQKCLGYQKRHDGTIASVIQSIWEDGTVDYQTAYSDENGNEHQSPSTKTKPRVDIPQD